MMIPASPFKNKTPLYLLLCLTVLLTSSCSSVIVSQDYDKLAPFPSYKLFAFEPKDPNRKTDSREDNELLNKRFYDVIHNRLQDKGFTLANNSGETDFMVSYVYSIRPKIDLYNIGTQIGFSYASYYRRGGIGSGTCTDISEFDQGILIVNIKDSKTGNLVWQGTGSDIVSIHANPEKITSQVNELVTSVIKQFPPM